MSDLQRFSRKRRATDDHILRIYTAAHCDTCHESRRLAQAVAQQLPAVAVEIVDIDRQEPVDDIFAVPTYCYRGRILSLGNPTVDDLCERVMRADRELGAAESTSMAERSTGRVGGMRDRSHQQTNGPALAASCGALGIGGTVLCSLSMLASAAGLFAAERAVGHAGSGSGRPQGPGWFDAIVRFGPEILVASILLVAVAVALRTRVGLLLVVLGGIVLYVGMYVQPDQLLMYLAMVLGVAVVLSAYARSVWGGLVPGPWRAGR